MTNWSNVSRAKRPGRGRRVAGAGARGLALLLACLGPALPGAAGEARPDLSVACRLPEKAALKEAEGAALCALFLERLALAWPGYALRGLAEAQSGADLVLVVTRSDARTLAARIDLAAEAGQAGRAGQTLATARRDAPLDRAARAQLFDELIAETPRP